MRYILENDTLRVEIESFGAEIKSVKRKADGREYMWCGDPEYWAEHRRCSSRLSRAEEQGIPV